MPTVKQLQMEAKKRGLHGYSTLCKDDLERFIYKSNCSDTQRERNITTGRCRKVIKTKKYAPVNITSSQYFCEDLFQNKIRNRIPLTDKESIFWNNVCENKNSCEYLFQNKIRNRLPLTDKERIFWNNVCEKI